MKELNLLNEWADGVISEAGKRAEAPPTRLGTPMKGQADRPLPRHIDIQYKAQRAHPELSPEQALAMYMSDELVDKEKMDFAQNKLINRVKGENDKLTRTVSELSKELHDFERQSQQTDQEVERLKSLSGKLKPAGELQQQVVKASHAEVQKMLQDLEALKTKPGMDSQKYQELKAEIEKVKTNPSSDKQIKELTGMLDSLASKPQVDSEYFNKVTQRLQAIEKHEASLRGEVENKLKKKEERFKDYVNQTNTSLDTYKEKFEVLADKLSGLEERADDLLIDLDSKANDAQEKINQMAAQLAKINPGQHKSKIGTLASKVASKQDQEDQHEVDVARTQSSTTVPPAVDDAGDDLPFDNALPDQDEFGLDDIDELPKKFNSRLPKNVKGNGQMNEQIEMVDTDDEEHEFQTVLLPVLIRRYEHLFPQDLRKWSLGQLTEIFRRTVHGGLYLYDDPTDDQIDNYLKSCHNWLMKTRPAQQDWISQNSGSVQESVFNDFLTNVNRLAGGY